MDDKPQSNEKVTDISAIVNPIGSAVVWAIGAAILSWLLSLMFPWAKILTDNLLLIALGAAVFGGITSWLRGTQKRQRQQQVRKFARQQGMKELEAEAVESPLAKFFGSIGWSQVENQVQEQLESTQLTVADVEYTRRRINGSEQIRQTVAHFQSDKDHWSEFTLRPKEMLADTMSSLAGIPTVPIEDHPDFSRQYQLISMYPYRTKQLFTSRLLHLLGDHPGLHVRTTNNAMVIYKHDRICPPDKLEQFVKIAKEVFHLLDTAARETPPDEKAEQERRTAVDNMPGMIGRALRGHRVTAEDVAKFIAEPPPRSIPENIWKRQAGNGNFMLCLAGFGFALIGAIFLCTMGLLYQYGQDDAKPVSNTGLVCGLVTGGLVFVLGSLMSFFAVRHRWRTNRLLRHGIVTTGEVLQVSKGDWIIDGQQQYHVRVRVAFDGKDHTETLSVYGTLAEKITEKQNKSEPVTILHDPKRIRNMVLTDTLMR